ADRGLEPLALGVDQADGRDRSARQGGGDAGEVVEGGLGRGIEEIQAAQDLESAGFIRMELGGGHGASLYPRTALGAKPCNDTRASGSGGPPFPRRGVQGAQTSQRKAAVI